MQKDDMLVALRFGACARLRGPIDAVRAALVLPDYGFVPAYGKLPNLLPIRDIAEHVQGHAYTSEKTGNWFVTFPVLPNWTSGFDGGFECSGSKEGPTLCTATMSVDPALLLEADPAAQRLLRLGFGLYPLAQPALGWLDDSTANATLLPQVRATKLLAVSWVNFFGPPYVAKYGREMLLGIPGHSTGKLSDGGVFHQLTPTFLVDDAKEARALRKAVKDYFARAGIRVTCQAPYVRSQFFGEEEAPPGQDHGYGTPAGFRKGLAALLAPTLVMKDGSRAKVVYLEWQVLTPEQRRLALEGIRRAAEVELAKHPEARVRFEFNEIPADLRQLMEGLVGASPRLSFSQVDMSPDR